MAKQRGLGRGLESLIPAAQTKAAASAPPAEGVWELEVAKIPPSPWQPRREFNQERLEELAQSIKEHGLMNPLVVRRRQGDAYELISGERRLRAIRDVLGWEKAPVRLMTVEDAQMREHALVENLQREDLNPIEEAAAYEELKKDLGLTDQAIADRLKISRPKVTNTMRLMELPEEIKRLVVEGSLAAGTARALLGIKGNPLSQIKLAKRAVEEGLSTRAVEQLAAERRREKPAEKDDFTRRPPHVVDLEDRLRRFFDAKVKVEDDNGKGRLVFEYHSVADAQRILDRMGLPPE